MKKYKENPTDLGILEEYEEYADVMEEYTETMKALDEIKNSDLNDAELKYLLKVTNRINEKIIDLV